MDTSTTDDRTALAAGDEGEVRRDLVLPVSAEEAWALVSEPEHLREWFAPDVELDLREGGEAVFGWEDGRERHAVLEEVDAPGRLAFRWRDVAPGAGDGTAASRVVIELEPAVAGTRLVVRERALGPTALAGAASSAAAVGLVWEARLVGCARAAMLVTA